MPPTGNPWLEDEPPLPPPPPSVLGGDPSPIPAATEPPPLPTATPAAGSAPMPGSPGGPPLPPEWLNRGPGPGDIERPTEPGGPHYGSPYPGSAQNGPDGGGVPLPPPPGAEGGLPGASQEDIDAYNRWLARVDAEREARNNPAPPPAQSPGVPAPAPAPTPGAPPPPPAPAPGVPAPPPVEPGGPNADFSDMMRKYIEDLLNGKNSRYGEDVVTDMKSEAVATAQARAKAAGIAADKDAAKRGVYRAGFLSDTKDDIQRGASQDVSKRFAEIRFEKAKADIDDRLAGLDRGQKWLDSMRSYNLATEQNKTNRDIADAQIKLGYSQIDQQRDALEKELASREKLLQMELASRSSLLDRELKSRITLLDREIAARPQGGGGGNAGDDIPSWLFEVLR